MFQTIYEDEFVIFQVDHDNSIFLERWKPVHKEEKEWLEIQSKALDIIFEKKLQNFLGDNTESITPIPLETQQKFLAEVARRNTNKVIKKVAMVLPQDILVRISLEQISEGVIGKVGIPMLFFDKLEDALNWLKNKSSK